MPFFEVVSRFDYLCLQQRPQEAETVSLPPRFFRVPDSLIFPKRGYDLVTQLRFYLAFFRFPLSLPFLLTIT